MLTKYLVLFDPPLQILVSRIIVTFLRGKRLFNYVF